jgi:hypothetical protein
MRDKDKDKGPERGEKPVDPDAGKHVIIYRIHST